VSTCVDLCPTPCVLLRFYSLPNKALREQRPRSPCLCHWGGRQLAWRFGSSGRVGTVPLSWRRRGGWRGKRGAAGGDRGGGGGLGDNG
jgi:hypothetical protein